jgi:hypothetical protein
MLDQNVRNALRGIALDDEQDQQRRFADDRKAEEDSSINRCAYCHLPVDRAAMKCPHCHEAANGWLTFKTCLMLGLAIAVIAWLYYGGPLAWLDSMLSALKDY